ncbi:MAG: cyclic nucleotide-binding domain-containing protein [Lachnospiraceae bacterium]|nr:cyclic nucleotide-binding domain-containing protein [Lachnospiraceae bacterium]MCR5477373.1 cyclic nucleotide-binding domain-containing protein [Lachnospiraceae bacterium]
MENNKNNLEKLASFPLLSGITPEDLSDLFSVLTEKHISQGENIITEGDSGSEMYILMEGRVDIIKTTVFGDRFVVCTLEDYMHCVFGEMALIDTDKRSATVHAMTDCTCLVVSKESFNAFLASHPAAGVELLKFISINLVRNLRKENDNLNLVYQALIEEIENR